MNRPENEKFDKAFYERNEPTSKEDVLRLEAKMKMRLRVQKIMDEAKDPPSAPPVKTEEQKEKERVDYMRSRSVRHLGAE